MILSTKAVAITRNHIEQMRGLRTVMTTDRFTLEIIADADRRHGGPAIVHFTSPEPFMVPRRGDVLLPSPGGWPETLGPHHGFRVLDLEHFIWTTSQDGVPVTKQKMLVFVDPFNYLGSSA